MTVVKVYLSNQMLIHNKLKKVKSLKILRMIKFHYKHYRLIIKGKVILKIDNLKKRNEIEIII